MAVVRRTLHSNSTSRSLSRTPLALPWFTRLFLPPMLPLAVRVGSIVLAFVAIGMLFQATAGWFTRSLDDVRYGFPRSVQINGYVGHGDERLSPTIIRTMNVGGQITTHVMPGGDASRVQVLKGPYLFGADNEYVVAQPELHNLNGDEHVDLLVNVRGEVLVYLNDNGNFRVGTPEELAAITLP